MRKSRLYFDENFNVTFSMVAIMNTKHKHPHIFTLNGKNNFSNDEYGRPGGMANKSDP